MLPTAYSIRYMLVWVYGRGVGTGQSAGAVRFNSRIPLAKANRVGRLYLITKKEQDVKTRSLTVCLLWAQFTPLREI